MPPKAIVLKLFGGVRPTARLLGISPSSVSRWVLMVPQRHHLTLIAAAQRMGKRLTANDLVRGRK